MRNQFEASLGRNFMETFAVILDLRVSTVAASVFEKREIPENLLKCNKIFRTGKATARYIHFGIAVSGFPPAHHQNSFL